MALSFLNIFKKEEKETETAKVEGFDPKANAEEKKDEASKGGHGGAPAVVPVPEKPGVYL